LGVGLTTIPCKKKIVEKPPRNSAGFCGGGQGLNWVVEPREEEEMVVRNVPCVLPMSTARQKKHQVYRIISHTAKNLPCERKHM
jgi:hypothetical protein